MALLELLEHLRNSFLTDLNMVFTVMGEDLLILAIFCLIFWCIDKKLSYRICFISILSGLFIHFLNITVRMQFPYQKNSSLTPINQATKITSGYAFPCKNIPFVSSVLIALVTNVKKIYLKLIFILPLLMLIFSYLYLGIYSPYDILSALAITLIFSALLYHLFKNYSLDRTHLKWIILFFITAITLLVSYSYYIYATNNDVSVSAFSDLFKFAGFAIAFIPCWYIENNSIRFCETAATIPVQIIKYVLGIDIVFAIKFGVSYLFELLNVTIWLNNFITYFLVTIFIINIYPYIIKVLFSNKIQAYRRY